MSGPSPKPAMVLFWVALGAIPGALLRWALASTTLANTLGCFVVGASGLLGSPPARRTLVLGIGFAGSLTTFSTWVLELLKLTRGGQWGGSLGKLLGDGALGVGSVLLGDALYRGLRKLRERRLRR